MTFHVETLEGGQWKGVGREGVGGEIDLEFDSVFFLVIDIFV